jgi:hypothetical protein
LPTELQDAIFEREFSNGVLRVLEEQEEFANGKALMVNLLDGRLGFQSQFAVVLLMRQARRMSAEAAVGWLEKVFGMKSAAGIAVYTLRGIDPGRPVHLLDDIDLLPFDSLPDSRQKEGLTSPQWPNPLYQCPCMRGNHQPLLSSHRLRSYLFSWISTMRQVPPKMLTALDSKTSAYVWQLMGLLLSFQGHHGFSSWIPT